MSGLLWLPSFLIRLWYRNISRRISDIAAPCWLHHWLNLADLSWESEADGIFTLIILEFHLNHQTNLQSVKCLQLLTDNDTVSDLSIFAGSCLEWSTILGKPKMVLTAGYSFLIGSWVLNVYLDPLLVGQVTPWVQASLFGRGNGTQTTTSPLQTAVSLLVSSSVAKIALSVFAFYTLNWAYITREGRLDPSPYLTPGNEQTHDETDLRFIRRGSGWNLPSSISTIAVTFFPRGKVHDPTGAGSIEKLVTLPDWDPANVKTKGRIVYSIRHDHTVN